jgi:sugar/nucleoside kinase (ribokinase family)
MKRVRRFDAICAGETIWKGLAPGGAVNVAAALARDGLDVGLATVLTDDTFGRRARDKVQTSGVDVRGVRMVTPRSELLIVGRSTTESPFEIPDDWSTDMLVLSGLSPVVAHAAALYRAARHARRSGAVVVIDFNARLHAWAGRDPRTIRMVLREVDVARCSIADIAVLGMDIATVQASLRPSAVLVVSDGIGGAVATGPFGEVSAPPRHEPTRGDFFTAGICTALLQRGERGESVAGLWHRALSRAGAA